MSTTDEDIQIAMAGGSTFSSRVEQLGVARQQLMQAYNDLKIGQSAQVAYEAAEADKKAAAALLKQAEEQAEEVHAKARAQAAKILADAEADRAAAQGLLEEAKNSVREQKAEARADRLAASKERKDGEARLAKAIAEAEEAKAAALAAKDNAEGEVAAAREAADRFMSRLAKLNQAIAAIASEG